ncbi:hypothetical protein HK101_002490 [Irineochytrium annulatum]|nr:hypothetical protein HK101_002490 [Irineochytrium annulatum]
MPHLFESGLGPIFDEPRFAHGGMGERYVLDLPATSDRSALRAEVDIPTPADQNVGLQAHYVWQSSVVLSRLIASEGFAKGCRVLEMGAGAGLCSVVAGLCGARMVVTTDYPDEGITACLVRNLARNLGEDHRVGGSASATATDGLWDVIPHAWAEPSLEGVLSRLVKWLFGGGGNELVHVLLADVLWISASHGALLSDLDTILSRAPQGSAVHVTAGYHTGLQAVESFFTMASEREFAVERVGHVRVGSIDGEYQYFGSNEVLAERNLNDASERKRWVVMYRLRKDARSSQEDANLQEIPT